jgi:4a-hydroxytetrahydrobiopterin dehydratase
MPLLTASEVAEKLVPLPEWRLCGDVIERTMTFADFPAAISFVHRVAEAAERAGHHPDIDIRWNKVRLALSSHDAGGLTELDFGLAAEIDSLL